MQEATSPARPEPRRRARLVRVLATASVVAGAVVGLAPEASAAGFTADSASPTYTCASDNDPTTTTMLGLLPGGVVLNPTVSVAALDPGPAQGATFSPQFGYSVSLPPAMVTMATGLGLTSVNVSGMSMTVAAGTGVSGGPLVAALPDQTVTFATSSSFTVGPFTGPFTRTAADGAPLGFTVGNLKMSVGLVFNGNPVTLKMVCAPSGDTALALAAGAVGPTTTSTTSTTTTASTSTSTTGTVPGTVSTTTTTTAAPTTSTTAPQITSLPGGSTSPTYTCGSDGDPTTTQMLGLMGGPVALAPQLAMAAISPSPAQGASFTPSFTYGLTLPESMKAMVTGLGVTSVDVSGMSLTVSAGDGVSGGPLVATLPDQTITFANASGFSTPPFGGTAFTRTSAVGQPVAFVAGDLKMTISLSLAGNPVSLKLLCVASGATALSVTDVQGAPPVTTAVLGVQQTRSGGTTGGTQGQLARTGGDNLELSLLSAILIGLGVAAFNEGALRRWRRGRSLR